MASSRLSVRVVWFWVSCHCVQQSLSSIVDFVRFLGEPQMHLSQCYDERLFSLLPASFSTSPFLGEEKPPAVPLRNTGLLYPTWFVYCWKRGQIPDRTDRQTDRPTSRFIVSVCVCGFLNQQTGWTSCQGAQTLLVCGPICSAKSTSLFAVQYTHDTIANPTETKPVSQPAGMHACRRAEQRRSGEFRVFRTQSTALAQFHSQH